jgi:hypothetical protein
LCCNQIYMCSQHNYAAAPRPTRLKLLNMGGGGCLPNAGKFKHTPTQAGTQQLQGTRVLCKWFVLENVFILSEWNVGRERLHKGLHSCNPSFPIRSLCVIVSGILCSSPLKLALDKISLYTFFASDFHVMCCSFNIHLFFFLIIKNLYVFLFCLLLLYIQSFI